MGDYSTHEQKVALAAFLIDADRPVPDIAADLGVHPSHVYNFRAGRGISPTLHRAAMAAGVYRPERCQLKVDAPSAAFRDWFGQAADRYGMSRGDFLVYLCTVSAGVLGLPSPPVGGDHG